MFLKLAAILLSLFTFSACHASPLLNHRNAGDLIPAGNEVPFNTSCAIPMYNKEVCVQIEWIKGPLLKVENSFKMIVTDKTGNKFNPSAIEVELWMPSMGHGSSPTSVSAVVDGEFLVNSIYFIMRGDWDVIIRLKVDNKVDEVSLPFVL